MTAMAAPDLRHGATPGRADGAEPLIVCPRCRTTLEVDPRPRRTRPAASTAARVAGVMTRAVNVTCPSCFARYGPVGDIADLRVASDRYLSLGEDRAKAESLGASARAGDFSGAALAYYAMTGDVDADRRSRYLAHLVRAEARGAAMARLLPRSGRVLEVGCGSGGLLKAASRIGIAIRGVDIAMRWLVLARKRFPEARVIGANAEALPWADGAFDCVTADSLLEHLDDPAAALREWLRVTRPGGRLLLWSPNRFSLLRDPHVGLFGVGWMPRRWQSAYVRSRRGCEWPLRLFSTGEAARLAREAGWTSIRVGPAPAPGEGSIFRLYDACRELPIASSLLRTLGPLWQLTATRGGDS